MRRERAMPHYTTSIDLSLFAELRPLCCGSDITSDSGAIAAISGKHHYNDSAAAAVTAAIEAGCDINSGGQYLNNVQKAVQSGLLNISLVDAALVNAFEIRSAFRRHHVRHDSILSLTTLAQAMAVQFAAAHEAWVVVACSDAVLTANPTRAIRSCRRSTKV